MTDLRDNRIVAAFRELRAARKKTLIPFLTAGFPDLRATEALLGEIESRGVRVAELGIPFSDPIADGPTIQASFTEALAAGATREAVFQAVRRWRDAGGRMALAAMVSYSIVFRRGVADYLADAAAAGFDGVIVPDLPLEEAAEAERLARGAGLANVMLIAPTTPPARRLEIARHSSGFLYYVSVAGITGERDRLPAATAEAVAELRKHTDTPVAVGFGISRPEMVAEVCRTADAAIVGSAIVHRVADAKDQPTGRLAASVGAFVAELLAPLQ